MSTTSVIAAPFPMGGYPAFGLYMFQAYSTDAGRPVADPHEQGPRGSCCSIAAITPSVVGSSAGFKT